MDGEEGFDIVRRILANAKSIAFYDLKLPGRQEWLEGEVTALSEAGFEIVELPDGAEIEKTWERSRENRLKLESIRVELGGSVDGEAFFRAARRAAWIVDEVQPERIYAAGIAESLAAWLVSRLMDQAPALSLAFDAQQNWRKALLQVLAAAAEHLSDGTRIYFEDVLQHGAVQPRRRRLGPIKWKTRGVEPDSGARAELLASWL
ncbi:MAG: hypothetical protein ACI8UO_001144 [Verrucomicrobiales bacterium]